MIHTVKQGETLSHIALHYGFPSIDTIYNHSDNADFKALRPNPNVIHPKDKIFIPEISPAKHPVDINKNTRFIIKRPKEALKLHLKLEEDNENTAANKEAILIVDDVKYNATIDGDGVAEWKLPKTLSRTGLVHLFIEPDDKQPTHVFEVKIGALDPVTENTGIQARLNGLGFQCGNVDNRLRDKSEDAIREFQQASNLTVDGIAGPNTQQSLEKQYGC